MNRPAIHSSTREYVNSVAIAHDYDRHFTGEDLFDYDSIMLDRWFGKPKRLIDLGCGTGRHLVQFARKGCEVVGVDLSAEMLAQAQAKLSAENLNATLLLGDLNHLTEGTAGQALLKECFDGAICMFSTLGLIYGHNNRLEFLRNLRQLLEPGGQLALHVHNYGYNICRHEGRMFLLSNLARRILGRDELGDKYMSSYRGIRGMYIHVFRMGEIQRLLAQARFEVLELLPLNRRRTGPLRPRRLATILANGFLVRARRLDRPGE